MTEHYESSLAVVIPSYNRGPVLLNTVRLLLAQTRPADEIVIVDQSHYQPDDEAYLALVEMSRSGQIIFVRRQPPGIPAAMNHGLLQASSDYVLFLDDDIHIDKNFIAEHRKILLGESGLMHVGQVLQPGQTPSDDPGTWNKDSNDVLTRDLAFPFNYQKKCEIHNVMAGNLCVHRTTAIEVGGFDENFLGAAYRFETEFCRRMIERTKKPALFVPNASIDHLKVDTGGTRDTDDFLASTSARHSVGDYYFSLRRAAGFEGWRYRLARFSGSILARYYVRHPWRIPGRYLAELRGWSRARRLNQAQPRLLSGNSLQSYLAGQSAPRRVAVVISHATQHFVPVYQALAREQGMQLKVFFVSENGRREYTDKDFDRSVTWDIPLFAGYAHHFLEPGKVLNDFGFFDVDSVHVRSELESFDPDVIWLNGYSHRVNWRVLWHAKRRANVIYSSDSNLLIPRSRFRSLLKQVVVRYFLSRCDHFLCVSEANRAYLNHYGVSAGDISDVPYPVDVARLQAQAAELDHADRLRLRDSLGIPASDLLLVFAGKLIEHKCPQDVLSAMVLLADQPVSVIMLGSGPLENALRKQIDSLGLQSNTKLVGFVNQSELADYLNCADLMVFPSSKEPFGAIASEGLVFGLPVVAAREIGAIGKAILPGENAELFDAGNVQELADKITLFVNDPGMLAAYSARSKALAELQDARLYAAAIKDFAGGFSSASVRNG